MKIKSYMSGLKCANIPRFLRDVAWDIGLEIQILERDKGLLRETVYFELEGEQSQLLKFDEIVKNTIKNCNGGE